MPTAMLAKPVARAELDGQIRQEREARADLERTLAEAEAARSEVQQQHDAALAAAALELVEYQARFDRELSQMAAARDRLARHVLTDRRSRRLA